MSIASVGRPSAALPITQADYDEPLTQDFIPPDRLSAKQRNPSLHGASMKQASARGLASSALPPSLARTLFRIHIEPRVPVGRTPETPVRPSPPPAQSANPPHTPENRLQSVIGTASASTASDAPVRPSPPTGGNNNAAALPASYAAQPNGSLQAYTGHPGILVDANGQRYVKRDESYYPVRFDTSHDVWRVYQPDNPARPGLPVRQNADGEWQPQGGVGLLGGSDREPSARERQREKRWDVAKAILLEFAPTRIPPYSELADRFGLSHSQLSHVINDFGLARQSANYVTSEDKLRIMNTLRDRPEMTFEQIAASFNVKQRYVELLQYTYKLRPETPDDAGPLTPNTTAEQWKDKRIKIGTEILLHPDEKWSSVAKRLHMDLDYVGSAARRYGLSATVRTVADRKKAVSMRIAIRKGKQTFAQIAETFKVPEKRVELEAQVFGLRRQAPVPAPAQQGEAGSAAHRVTSPNNPAAETGTPNQEIKRSVEAAKEGVS